MEIWKDIPNYNGIYKVSNLGNIKSFKYSSHKNGKLLNPFLDEAGYKRITLMSNSICKKFRVHQLVAMAFLGHKPCGVKLVIDHIDNDKSNNKLENIQIVTSRINNSKDKKGTSKYTGVCWDKSKGLWKSQIKTKGISKHLGNFKNEYDAHLAYQKALNKTT